MKQIIFLTICTMLLVSCEDVIDVDLNDAQPRLVVESSINILESGARTSRAVRLTTTAPFFDGAVPVVDDAVVQISDENGIIIPLEYIGEGLYDATFFPRADVEYTLQIIYKSETYSATTKFVPTVPLEYVEQRNDGGFSGDRIELKAYFTDPPGIKNFYYVKGVSERGVTRNVIDDEFFDGNLIFSSYSAEDLAPCDEVQFNLYGITEEYYNYMSILLSQTGPGGGPFETQPATVKGNIINLTKPENYPLGYFRISEVSILNYTVQ